MEKQIIESCVRRRIPLPEKIANAPRLHKGLEGYIIAFWELTTDRPAGFGVAPIPWSSIDRYAVREGMDPDEYDDLVDMIRAMDRTFLAYAKERADAEASKGKDQGPIGSRRVVPRR